MDRLIVKKVFFVWNSDKEKAWLESMARDGYILESLGLFKYIFRKSEPSDLVYEFDFQILNKKTEPDYLELFVDWNFVGKFGAWYYFSKIREGNKKDLIYNDTRSKQQMIKKILAFLLIIGFPLYYQIIIMFPNMDSSEFLFPRFYFFFRIIVIIVLMAHTYALINVLLIYRSLTKDIKE
ncbi:hypothetical protein KQ51_00575 [Candidatus Izimaplasma bacterium HR1]|jgi:hypothetical protein|uniref:DUF2812 domain-containing protein n=1 Tax=Candidatus Izimoplasma sp. HR1 TaxID=1541959 RepID=UPI0004F86782|nr:hypothetical protein KQ51_00575 [Candidatus Izimaplasma bacterium HR1]